jgi:hypothetical protein
MADVCTGSGRRLDASTPLEHDDSRQGSTVYARIRDMSRPDEDYIDTFERWWALATGLVAFVLPWFVFITSISNDSRLAWGVRMVWMALLLGVLLGVVCVIAGRRSRRIGRIGTAIIIGDVVGALLFFVSLILWLVVGYTFFYRDG